MDIFCHQLRITNRLKSANFNAVNIKKKHLFKYLIQITYFLTIQPYRCFDISHHFILHMNGSSCIASFSFSPTPLIRSIL